MFGVRELSRSGYGCAFRSHNDSGASVKLVILLKSVGFRGFPKVSGSPELRTACGRCGVRSEECGVYGNAGMVTEGQGRWPQLMCCALASGIESLISRGRQGRKQVECGWDSDC